MELLISPQGHLVARDGEDTALAKLFAESAARGMLRLATADLKTDLPLSFDYVRQIAKSYLTRLCQTSLEEAGKQIPPVTMSPGDAATWVLQAPPMAGQEYLTPEILLRWWSDLDELVRDEIQHHQEGAQDYLSTLNPQWKFVGRVTFHLAENKRDPDHPFAFLATYASRMSAQGKVQHEPLAKALQNYAGARDRATLLALLAPIHKAAERSPLVRELTETKEIYHPLAWTPQDAYQFLKDIPVFEESGVIVRVPNWWQANRPPRPVVNVKIDSKRNSTLSAASLLQFSTEVALDGEPLTAKELKEILASTEGLVKLKGKWVEIDRDKLQAALDTWHEVEQQARHGLSFFEGMRLLSGLPLDQNSGEADNREAARDWSGLTAGPILSETLSRLRAPESLGSGSPEGLQAQLRPYQQTGWNWLRFLTRLGLGACLADDMGLGKTVQVISLLLDEQREQSRQKKMTTPSLLVVPASLIANWKAELARFAPSLSAVVIHPSEIPAGKKAQTAADLQEHDLAITTYGMLTRTDWLKKQQWNLVVIDEAQAIKNSGTRQTRAVKELQSRARIAMTGTPVENRMSDLWSLFDFLNPGLLGTAKNFGMLVKRMERSDQPDYRPLRNVIQPYLLRRLKTDKRIIADLPEKTEINAFCSLTRKQAALYEQVVTDLAEKLESSDQGIQRRGLVLAQLMRLKQICNHPAQLLGSGEFDPDESGKFQRLREICEELAERQEKVLIFTQFRELTDPLSRFLSGVFGRSGLVLHGGTAVAKRRELVEAFQQIDGPPFFVLSLKAGGTGLNLTEASQVIHFDRWWNPAVENQATDRAFRIGQKRNVLVHKFVCRGTVEERINLLLADKQHLSNEIIEGGGEALLTEMPDEQLLKFVALDIKSALDS